MKKMIVAILLLFSTMNVFAQSILGNWQGTLAINDAVHIDLFIKIKQEEKRLVASMDVPIQNQFNLSFDQVKYHHNRLNLALSMAGIKMDLQHKNGQLVGTYYQGSAQFPLTLKTSSQSSARTKKPQEPVGKLPYGVEHVRFYNPKDDIWLSGTLNLPTSHIKHAVVLLSGSGASTRDEDVFGHKVFLVLADLLAKEGIAVLRFDDRGVGKSQGNYDGATTQDFAHDANAALDFLRRHNAIKNTQNKQTKFGFVGHSEGSLIAVIANTTRTNKNSHSKPADFIVSLAGPAIAGDKLLLEQGHVIRQKSGMPASEIKKADAEQKRLLQAIRNNKNKADIMALIHSSAQYSQAEADAIYNEITSPWMRFIIKTNPQTYLAKLTTPILAVNGTLDTQVLAKSNLAGFKKSVPPALLTIKEYAQLNHLFQPARTGLPYEYGQSKITFSKQVAKDVAHWVKHHE